MTTISVEPAKHRQAVAQRPAPRKFRPDIQGLRAIAVLLVALYHAGVPFLPGGYVGVDVFFVISGFLITRQLFSEAEARGRVRFINFYSKRFRRLLPPVVLVVAVTALVAHFTLPYTQIKSLGSDIYYASFYGINYHFAAEGVQYQHATAPPSPLQHFWSLAVEEQFYIFWPVIISLCAVIGRRRFRHKLTVLSIACLTGATLFYSAKISASNHSLAYFSLQTRAWELGAGALVALSLNRLSSLPPWIMRVVSWSGLAAIALGALIYNDRTIYPGTAALLPVLGAAALIAGGTFRNPGTPETAILDRPLMQFGGKVSYSWYLWHWPMLILLPAWVGHSLNTWENVEIVGLAFWFAVLTYFLENAAHRSHWNQTRWAFAGGILSGLVALSALLSGTLAPSLTTTGTVRTVTALTSNSLPYVQNQIGQSLFIHALPRNLTPSLPAVATDWPTTYATHCFAALTDTVPRACASGDLNAPRSRTAVLVGDSHADQWISALNIEARAAHWKIIEYTKAACSIAKLKLYNPDLGREYRECDQWRSRADNEITQMRPRLIIASQSDNVPGTSLSDQQWASDSVSALKQLEPQGGRVIYIQDSDLDPQDPLACLQSNLENAQKCTFKRASVYSYPERGPILQEAVTHAGFSYLPTTDFFCTKVWCPPVVQNMVVHRDPGHVTNTYATWLAPMFSRVFIAGGKK